MRFSNLGFVLCLSILGMGCAAEKQSAPSIDESSTELAASGSTGSSGTAKTSTQSSTTVTTSTASSNTSPFLSSATTGSTGVTGATGVTSTTGVTGATGATGDNECGYKYVNIPMPRTSNADLFLDLKKTVSCDFAPYSYLDTQQLAQGLAIDNGYGSYSGASYLSCYSAKKSPQGVPGYTKNPEVRAFISGFNADCRPVLDKVQREAGWYTYCHRGNCSTIYEGDISLIGRIRCCKKPVGIGTNPIPLITNPYGY